VVPSQACEKLRVELNVVAAGRVGFRPVERRSATLAQHELGGCDLWIRRRQSAASTGIYPVAPSSPRWISIGVSEPAAETTEVMGQHHRHEQSANPSDQDVPRLPKLESPNPYQEQVGDGEVEGAPERVHYR
jgi:hypothetical protein